MHPYGTLVLLMAGAVLFALLPLGLAWVWARAYAPKRPGLEKGAIYECGLESKGDAWMQFHPQYYLYGILFLVFDVEAVFLLPFAVSFLSLPTGAVVAMLIFLLLLVEGLAWAWQKGVMEWS